MVAAMAALPWLLRRWQRRTHVARGTTPVHTQVLGAAALGPGQRVVTVQVQREDHTVCLVLGVTAHNIQCLHVLPPQATSAAASACFAQVLQEQSTDTAAQEPPHV